MAEKVANKVVEMASKGLNPIVSKIAKEVGYSDTSAMTNKPQNTLTYQRTIGAYVKRLEKHREKVLRAMEAKDLDLEDYRILSESLDRLSKQSLLLQGKSTDNVAIQVNVVDYSKAD